MEEVLKQDPSCAFRCIDELFMPNLNCNYMLVPFEQLDEEEGKDQFELNVAVSNPEKMGTCA